jgi:uncharacterized protein (TIGR02757 family)
VIRAHRPTPALGEHLRQLEAQFPLARSLAQDPLSMVRPYARSPRAAEIAGIVAATLAVGSTAAIRTAIGRLSDRIDGDFEGWVDGMGPSEWRTALPGFRHRWVRGDQLGFLARRLRTTYASHGSLESVFREGADGGGFAGGIDAVSRALRAPGPDGPAPPGYDRLLPSPIGPSHSPCKRLTLFVRWMVRREYPDLGIWTRVSPSELYIPLDQHVYWIAYHLGLTQRRTRSWAAVEEVTEALRAFAPDDPIRYDFVLCHTGISGDCPKRRDLAVCAPCSVRPDCLLWRGVRRVAA